MPDWLTDVIVAAVAAAWIAYRISVGPGGLATTNPGSPAYALGLTMAAMLLARRRWPLTVLLVDSLLWLGYHIADLPGGAPAPALWVALFTVAASSGNMRRGMLLAAWLLTTDLAGRAYPGEHPGAYLLDAGADGSLTLAAAFLLGYAVRARDDLRRQAAQEREWEACRRVDEERLRIARDLHDILASTVSVITVHAGVAADVLDRRPAVARTAIETVRATCRQALAELRVVIGVLRQPAGHPRAGTAPRSPFAGEGSGSGAWSAGRPAPTGGETLDAPPAPAPRLDQLAQLLDTARGAGLRVDLTVVGEARAVPAAVELAAYRIIQESLTNVVRHAGAGVATIRIDYQREGMAVEVADDGRGLSAGRARHGQSPRSTGPSAGGYGLVGMAERAASVGGRLDVGPGHPAGCVVRAWLPALERP
ncbi:sensor histidine kinase [Pseudofrankia sp. EUN1h]|uniref:sensor histidine kinase n=1 Tax=Pseudofrankia sp. EUN1h TaxID=1834515 RepID=UPI0002E4F9AE|nr:sensor histidine kinase [Pseudofrankia sp. EUN1h]OHV39081.1 hypothetical protein BCD49_12305 [Pseudofrankia sp. EUN1h]